MTKRRTRKLENIHNAIKHIRDNWDTKKSGRITQLKIAGVLGVSMSTISRYWDSDKSRQVDKPKKEVVALKQKIEPKETYTLNGVVISEYDDFDELLMELAESIQRTKTLKAKLKLILK
jgi:transcriptional regulator with XRE-family HTH domain